MTNTMRAYISGDQAPLTSSVRPVPSPGPDDVLIRTRAVALNNADLTGAGEEHVSGYEFAGEVLEVGNNAPAALRGARVMGIAAGAFAEFVVAHHRHLLVMPHGLSFEEAATLPTALTTEHGALVLGDAAAADSALITAASSGLGLAGVQVAKVLGVPTVIATTRSEHKRALLERAGADVVVIASQQELAEATKEATNGDGAQLVLDHVGGGGLAGAVEAACAGGTVISVGRLGGPQATIDLFALARRHVVLRSISYGLTPPSVLGDLFDALAPVVLPALVDGRLRAIVDGVYPFEDAPRAFERLNSGQAQGKVALSLV